jgi:phosphate:Na+ symporter
VTDNIQKEVTLFLTTVMQMPLTAEQSARGYALIRIADEIESVGDYCASLAKYRLRLHAQKQSLSSTAKQELGALLRDTRDLYLAVVERIQQTEDKVRDRDLLDWGARHREHADEIRDHHLARVSAGTCDALTGLIFSDMIVALRRIKNHSINMVEARNSSWESRRDGLEELDVPLDHKSLRPPRVERVG